MRSWQTRFSVGRPHEKAVTERLIQSGWHAEPFGQGLFSDHVRTAMLRYEPKMMLRWLPDMIAERKGRLILVEAKSGWSKTDNWSLEIDSLMALTACETIWGIPVYIVWADFTCNRPRNLHPVKWDLTPKGWNAGSRTPYVLLAKADQHPWERAFGPITAQGAA